MRGEKIQLQSMYNAIIYFDKRLAVKNSGISCLSSIFDLLSNPRMKILQAKTRFKVAKYDNSYTVFFAGSI